MEAAHRFLHNAIWSSYDELALWHICTKPFAESNRILWSTPSIISDWNDITNDVQLLSTDKSRCPISLCHLTIDWLVGGNNVDWAVNLELSAKTYSVHSDPWSSVSYGQRPVTIAGDKHEVTVEHVCVVMGLKKHHRTKAWTKGNSSKPYLSFRLGHWLRRQSGLLLEWTFVRWSWEYHCKSCY